MINFKNRLVPYLISNPEGYTLGIRNVEPEECVYAVLEASSLCTMAKSSYGNGTIILFGVSFYPTVSYQWTNLLSLSIHYPYWKADLHYYEVRMLNLLQVNFISL